MESASPDSTHLAKRAEKQRPELASFEPTDWTRVQDSHSHAKANHADAVRNHKDSWDSWTFPSQSPLLFHDILTCDGVESETGEPTNNPDIPSLTRHVIEELRMQPVQANDVVKSGDRDSDVFLVTEADIQGIIDSALQWSKTAAPRHGKCIYPRPSTVLDPATTISVPRTLFSRSRHRLRRAKTVDAVTATIVSRRRMSDIIWARRGRLSDASDSEHSEDFVECTTWMHKFPPMGYLHQKRPKHKYAMHEHWVGNVICHPCEARPPQAFDAGLGHQECGFEWAMPWTDRNQSLYVAGIDAHCGAHCHTLFTEEAMQRRWTNPALDETWLVRRSTLALPRLSQAESVGMIASERRRSVPLNRIRRLLGPPHNSPTGTPLRIAGSPQWMRRCSEDGRPHVCENDLERQVGK